MNAMRLAGRLAVGRGLAGAPGVLALHDVGPASSFAATSRFRCRRTARISATSREAVFEAERDAISVLV